MHVIDLGHGLLGTRHCNKRPPHFSSPINVTLPPESGQGSLNISTRNVDVHCEWVMALPSPILSLCTSTVPNHSLSRPLLMFSYFLFLRKPRDSAPAASFALCFLHCVA